MNRISYLPSGLLSLLGIQNFGETPQDLANQVVGTLDLLPLYGLTRLELVTGSIAAPGVGANSTGIAVPPGELWWVFAYGLYATTGVGETIDYAPSVSLAGISSQLPVTPYAAAAASQSVRAAQTVPFFAPSGTIFGGLVRSVTGPPALTAELVFTRLKS